MRSSEIRHPKVVIGLSGGVDSAVAAWLLKNQGFEVIGVHLIFVESKQEMVEHVAQLIGIQTVTVEARDEFKRLIIYYFVNEYRHGRTPNPCALCNARLKLLKLNEIAVRFSAQFIATGHYVRIKSGRIYRAIDKSKDQSYFLALVPKDLVAKMVAPLGELTKAQVIEIAKRQGFFGEVPKESQDVCFLKGTTLEEFLRMHIGDRKGQILDEDGRPIGVHKGVHYYTLGQRRGLGVALGQRAYIVELDPEKNIVRLGRDARFKAMRVKDINWIVEPRRTRFHALVKIRQLHRPAPAYVELEGSNNAFVVFDEPQWAPTPGQIAAFYEQDLLLGGGFIEKPLHPSFET